MSRKRRQETSDSEDETIPGSDPQTPTGLGPEVLALTDHSDVAPFSLERDTVRDGVFVNLTRAFDSAPRVPPHALRKNETENNATLEYVTPLREEDLGRSEKGAQSSGAPQWDKRRLPLAPTTVGSEEPRNRARRVGSTAPPISTEPVVKFIGTPKK